MKCIMSQFLLYCSLHEIKITWLPQLLFWLIKFKTLLEIGNKANNCKPGKPVIRCHDTLLVKYRWHRHMIKAERGDRIHAWKAVFLECKWFPSRKPSWEHHLLSFQSYLITSQSLISLASPLLCGSYKRERDDCKAITAANIYFKDFFHCSFTLLFPIFSSFLSLPSSLWSFCTPCFSSLSSRLPLTFFLPFFPSWMFLCICKMIPQMNVLCSGKNLGFF